jgi:hypothetical protein
MFFTLISWFLISQISQPLYAQLPYNPDRFELIIPNNDPGFDVIPAKEYGVILHRTVFTNKSDHLEIMCADTAFTISWKGYLEVKRHYHLSGYSVVDGFLHLVFYRPDFQERSFYLYQVDLKTGDYTSYEVRNSIPFAPTSFEVTKQGALIGGYFIRVPVVLFFNFHTLRGNILPGLFNEAGELTQIKINSDGSFSLLISSKNFRNQKTIWVKNYSADGTLLKNIMIDPIEGYQLTSGSSFHTQDNVKIIAGVFTSRNLDYSEGIFVTQIFDSGDQFTQY